MCQQVINLSTACCQQMESVIIFSNLVTSTFSLQKAELERKPLWTLSTSQGSSRLWRRIWRALLHFCQAAEMQRSPCFPLGLICFHHVYRQGRGVFQLQTSGGRPAEEKCQKKRKSLRPSSETGAPVQRHTDRQSALSKCIRFRIWQRVYMGHGAERGVCAPCVQKWLLCLGLFLLLSLRKPHRFMHFSTLNYSWQPVITGLEAVIAGSV